MKNLTTMTLSDLRELHHDLRDDLRWEKNSKRKAKLFQKIDAIELECSQRDLPRNFWSDGNSTVDVEPQDKEWY